MPLEKPAAVLLRSLRWLWNGVQILFGLALGLALVEGMLHACPGLLPLGFRVFHDFKQPYTQYDEDFVVRGIPNLRLTVDSHPEYVMHIALNEKGYRDPLTSGKVHALVLGDSFIFGTGSEQEQTFCEQLHRLTGQPFVNLAIGSYGPAHHVQVLARDTDEFDAKLVLVMLSLNDIEDCGRFKEWRDRPYPRVPSPAALAAVPVEPAKPWKARLLDRAKASLTYRLVKWNLNPDKVNECFKTSLRHHEGGLDLEFNEGILSWADPEQGATPQNWELYEKAMKEIRAWSDRRGIPVAVVIVPSKEEVYRAARLRRR